MVVYVYLNGPRWCPALPLCRSPVLLWCWFCSCFQQNNSGTSWGCFALEGSCCWDQSSESFLLLGGISPGRTLGRQMLRHQWWQNQCLCGADSPAAVVSPPAPGKATLAVPQTCLRLAPCLLRPLISSPPAFIISAFSPVHRSLLGSQ